MTLRQYLIIMSLASAICWAVWIAVVFFYDPQTAGLFGFLLFYISQFLAVLGTFSVTGFFIRSRIAPSDDVVFRYVKKTFRQGFLFSGLLTLALLLLQFRLLTWWNTFLLVALYIFLEVIIFTQRKYQNRNYVK